SFVDHRHADEVTLVEEIRGAGKFLLSWNLYQASAQYTGFFGRRHVGKLKNIVRTGAPDMFHGPVARFPGDRHDADHVQVIKSARDVAQRTDFHCSLYAERTFDPANRHPIMVSQHHLRSFLPRHLFSFKLFPKSRSAEECLDSDCGLS